MKRQPMRSQRLRERERDLKAMLAQLQRTEARVAEAVVTVLHRADPRTLVAFGVLLEFVARQRGRRTR